jgi:hypothetical protein
VGSFRADTLSPGAKFSSKTLKPGKVAPLYVNSLNDDKLPKLGVQPGEFLTGRFTLSKSDAVKKKVRNNFESV